jgi:hypothetical protein
VIAKARDPRQQPFAFQHAQRLATGKPCVSVLLAEAGERGGFAYRVAVSRQRAADARSRPSAYGPVDPLVPCESRPQEPPLIISQLREIVAAYGRLVSSKHERCRRSS